MNELVFYYPQGHEAHVNPGHPERPERVEAIRGGLQRIGWWDGTPQLTPAELSEAFLASVHTPAYLTCLRDACQQGAHLDMDTYTTTASFRLALNVAGGAVAVANSVWQGESQAGFALTRPPGHHATSGRGMGFCLLNNIALATEYLLSQSLENVSNAERLAIIDLDLHHGNGTQEIFWQRGDVLYISTHQSPHYPGTGNLYETGAGPGEGMTANFPLPPFTGDEGFKTIMDEFIIPLIDHFQPQMLLVSFGFDPHWRDPLGNLMLSAQGYRHLIARLAGWAKVNCRGKIALFLEGGYDLEAGVACTEGVLAALTNREWKDPLGPGPQHEANSWQTMAREARQLWNL